MKDSFFGTLHGQGQEVIRFFTESKVVIRAGSRAAGDANRGE